MQRRAFVGGVISGSLVALNGFPPSISAQLQLAKSLPPARVGEDIFAYLIRQRGKFDLELYCQILGAANAFKEGDQIVGVAAADEQSRRVARELLFNTSIQNIDAHPPWADELSKWILPPTERVVEMRTIGELKQFLVTKGEPEIHATKDSLSSDVIACVVKLMSNEELIAVGAKVFNSLPHSKIGANGYLGARIQIRHAKSRTGSFGLYFETGQGADFTNGHSHGMDMLIHESRKYGFARSLTETVRSARVQAGQSPDAWVHVNDVAGFIGPEVFRSKEQLVRCCLEDIVMGKLHGLAIGLDVCCTLHMDASLDDLDWCLDQVAPACPAYLMALPTKIDPMLGYLTTGFQDHVRLREKFGYRVNDRMWKFFQDLQVVDANDKPTEHFGDPTWVYLQYQQRKGDQRDSQAIVAEGREQLAEIRSRGVFVAEGHGKQTWDLNEKLSSDIRSIYTDAKQCIWREWEDGFVSQLPKALRLETRSANREAYILHPTSGEQLSDRSRDAVRNLRNTQAEPFNCVIVASEGLNALAAMDDDQLMPLVSGLREELKPTAYRVAPQLLVVNSGRVRAGYITSADGSQWSIPNAVDHNITRVVSGIATTALLPELAVKECLKILV